MTAKVRVREASLDDYEALITLFDELDEFHRQARPDFFRPFDGPARTREQIEQWLIAPNSTVLVAQAGQAVVGLAVLLTRPASGFSGALPRRMVEVDNLVVRADQRGRRIGHQSRISKSRCTPSIAMHAASTRISASRRRSIAW